jgi:hypothetical protein
MSGDSIDIKALDDSNVLRNDRKTAAVISSVHRDLFSKERGKGSGVF